MPTQLPLKVYQMQNNPLTQEQIIEKIAGLIAPFETDDPDTITPLDEERGICQAYIKKALAALSPFIPKLVSVETPPNRTGPFLVEIKTDHDLLIHDIGYLVNNIWVTSSKGIVTRWMPIPTTHPYELLLNHLQNK